MPLALEQLDLRAYDLVISSESGPAKELADAYGFSPEAIADKVKTTLKK